MNSTNALQTELIPIYILDATVLFDIGRRYYPPEIQKKAEQILYNLAQNKMLISSLEVHEEIYTYSHYKSGDRPAILSHNFKKLKVFLSVNELDAKNVSKILKKFPEFLKIGSRRDADPWVVALAMRIPNCRVVTRDGSKDTPGLLKMKQICKHYQIECITEFELLKSHGLSI